MALMPTKQTERAISGQHSDFDIATMVVDAQQRGKRFIAYSQWGSPLPSGSDSRRRLISSRRSDIELTADQVFAKQSQILIHTPQRESTEPELRIARPCRRTP